MADYTIKPLVTATAVNTGGRNGHSETTDHSVSVNLSMAVLLSTRSFASRSVSLRPIMPAAPVTRMCID